jgi:hypothetical protein
MPERLVRGTRTTRARHSDPATKPTQFRDAGCLGGLSESVLLGGGSDVCAFSLLADEAEKFHGSCAGGSEPVRGAGVELGGLARLEDDVVLAEDESESAVEDECPVVALVGAQVGFGIVSPGGDDELVGLDATWSAGQGQDG